MMRTSFMREYIAKYPDQSPLALVEHYYETLHDTTHFFLEHPEVTRIYHDDYLKLQVEPQFILNEPKALEQFGKLIEKFKGMPPLKITREALLEGKLVEE